MQPSARVIYSFPKNSRETVHASLSTSNGLRLADLRVFTVDDDDVEHPTKKGISVRVEQLPQLLEAVETLLQAERAA